jgi:hypothetical protein
MLRIRDLLPRKTATTTATSNDAELLALLDAHVEDPEDLRLQLAAFEEQRQSDDARWEALDRAASNPRGFVEQSDIAARRAHLEAQIDALRPRIAAAEARRAAYLDLAQLLAETDETIATLAAALYAQALGSTEAERREQLVALDGQIRLRGRLAAALASVSSARRFRRGGPDPFGNLRSDLLARVAEIDRFRAPGSARPSVPWPPGALQLMDALARKGGTA